MSHIDGSSLRVILVGLLHNRDLTHHLLHALLLSHLELLEGALLPRPPHILVQSVDVLLEGLMLLVMLLVVGLVLVIHFVDPLLQDEARVGLGLRFGDLWLVRLFVGLLGLLLGLFL